MIFMLFYIGKVLNYRIYIVHHITSLYLVKGTYIKSSGIIKSLIEDTVN